MNALNPDPINPGWVEGWLVVQDPPGRFVSIHAHKGEAQTVAMALTDAHVIWGGHKPGTDDFMQGSSRQ